MKHELSEAIYSGLGVMPWHFQEEREAEAPAHDGPLTGIALLRARATEEASLAQADIVSHPLGRLLAETLPVVANALRIPQEEIGMVYKSTLRKVPSEDAHDWTQSLTLRLLETKPETAPIARGIALHTLADWWTAKRAWLDETAPMDDTEAEADRTAYQNFQRVRYAVARVRDEGMMLTLPARVRAIAEKKATGDSLRKAGETEKAKAFVLTGAERVALNAWKAKGGRSGEMVKAIA